MHATPWNRKHHSMFCKTAWSGVAGQQDIPLPWLECAKKIEEWFVWPWNLVVDSCQMVVRDLHANLQAELRSHVKH